MDIHLTPDLEKFVQSMLQAGRYNSASDVIREALRRMDVEDQFLEFQKEDIRNKIEEGWQSLRRGEGMDGEAVFARMEAEFEALAKAEKA